MAILKIGEQFEKIELKKMDTHDQIVAEMIKRGHALKDMNSEMVPLPVLKELSEIRKNILIWYPFKENSRILEIGGGYGGITSVLAKKAAQVTVIETSLSKANINDERNRSFENVEIIVDHLENLSFEHSFDYIILHDGFDGMNVSKASCNMVLKRLKGFLTDQGIILLVLNNRLGISRYGGIIDSLEELEIERLRTKTEGLFFSKDDICQMALESGLFCNEIYYPYPDASFPVEIFTDRSIHSGLYGKAIRNFEVSKVTLFNECRANQLLAKEGLANAFANSFLLEMTKKPVEKEERIDYVKLSTDRKPSFQIYTQIGLKNEEKIVSKIAAHEKAEAHIQYMLNCDEKQGTGRILQGESENPNCIVYPFLVCENMSDLFRKKVKSCDWTGCFSIFEQIFDTFLGDGLLSSSYRREEFKAVFGESDPGKALRCKKGMDIDIILDNIFIQDHELVLIDAEWIFNFDIPVTYVMWRVLQDAFANHPGIQASLNRNDIMHHFSITEELEKVFAEWEEHFQNEYVGNSGLDRFIRPERKVNIQKVVGLEGGYTSAMTTLYIDTGEGFNETSALHTNVRIRDHQLEVEYDLSAFPHISALRWDPIEDSCCCSNSVVSSANHSLSITPFNPTVTYNEEALFNTGDPCFMIKGNFSGIKGIKITTRITPLDMDRLLEIMQEEIQRQRHYIDSIHQSKLWFLFKKKDRLIKNIHRQRQKVQGYKSRFVNHFKRKKEEKKENIFRMFSKILGDDNDLTETDEIFDIIVPIYNGYDYLCKLFPGLLKTDCKTRIFLIDDGSPDPRVHQIEKAFEAEHDHVILIENEKNYGFVKSVNIGLEKSEHHVALVNTDTELPAHWLERLMTPIIHDERVASSTPYSNSATIFSFPVFCENNPIYRGLSVDEIDDYFDKVKPRYIEAPTGVGFCMGMNRKVINQIGTFDYETFSKGYGEENDWCRRAVKAGYKNVQVENLFVYHKHGGSFMPEEKVRLLEAHLNIVNSRYPDYSPSVAKFIQKDKNKDIRELIQFLIDCNGSASQSVLAFDHNLGGGATSYLTQKEKEFASRGDLIVVVRYDYLQNRYLIKLENEIIKKVYVFENFEEIHRIGKYLSFNEIWINELVTYPNLKEILSVIKSFKIEQQAKLVMLFHDYFAICPTINLLGLDQKYCYLPSGQFCDDCFTKRQCVEQYHCENVIQWRCMWKDFLMHCDEVRTFSQDTMNRVKQVYGDELNCSLIPHQVEYLFPINKKYKTTETFNIGLLGMMSIHKGGLILRDMLASLEKENPDHVRIILIGESEEQDFSAYANYIQTGRYQSENLVQLIYENDIDMFFIASVWPETFSYTTEEIIKMNMPAASFNIGAPAERIKAYSKGLVISEMSAKTALTEITAYMKSHSLPCRKDFRKKVVYLVEYVSFSSRYRIEHLREELMTEGIWGEIWTTEHIPSEIDWHTIRLLVIYRCRDVEPTTGLIDRAKAHHIPIWYDIDDLIFNYSMIKDLDFLADDEYDDFIGYSASIDDCIKKCDGIVTSTQKLQSCLQQSYPGKRIILNRNRASSQMMILSEKAGLMKRSEKDQVVLGYFSGSHTHNRDFAMISDVILEIMKKNAKVKLMIVGCLQLDPLFEQILDRVIRVDFVDWQKLPELMALTDINLMPLQNSLFHLCKSENKWMEAAFVGVPTIASFNAEIAGCTDDGENILLCKNTMDWYNHLQRLVSDQLLRTRIGQNALNCVKKEKSTLLNNENLYLSMFEKKGHA